MDNFTATEQAYKNGYEQGMKDAVKHGRWEITEDDFYMGLMICKCTVCREEICFEDVSDIENLNYNYCPNCGAKMDGGDNDA